MPTSVLRKATVETLSITPRRDGKVEIVLRVLADHERLTECAAKFIRAGCESFRLLDVFKHIAPFENEADFSLGAEPPRISPDVLPFDGERRVRMTGPVDVNHIRSVDTKGTTANDNAMTQRCLAAHFTELSIQDLASLLGTVEALRKEVAEFRAEAARARDEHYVPTLQRLLEKVS
jgi:hypothetical protein